MSLVIPTYMKGLIVTLSVVGVSIGTVVVVDDTMILIPQHQFAFELTDAINDISNSNIDIIAYGSYKDGHNVVLYLEVDGIIDSGLRYQLFIVAKYPHEETAHIYFNDVNNGSEENYQSIVVINGNRLEILFSTKNFVKDSYMVGIEARTVSFDEKDTTPNARDNPLQMKFLGLI